MLTSAYLRAPWVSPSWPDGAGYVVLRPEPDEGALDRWDIHKDLSISAFLTKDGRVCYFEILSRPDLRGVCCSREVARALEAAGHVVDWACVEPGSPLSAPGPRPPEEISLPLDYKVEVAAATRTLIIHLREGVSSFVRDLVGDGRVTVEFSYEGLALRVAADLGGPVIPNGIPCWEQIEGPLRSVGAEIADIDDPGNPQPFLDGLTRHGGALWGVNVRYSYAADRPTSTQAMPPNRSLVLGASGAVQQVNFLDVALGATVEGLPHADRVGAILSHQGVRLLLAGDADRTDRA